MTIAELTHILKIRRDYFCYSLWKEAVLVNQGMTGKFPESPKEAFEEFYPKPRLRISDGLMQKLKKGAN